MDEGAATGIAGARLADGRQVFVADAPLDLEAGTPVALWWNGQEQSGVVSIPPSLLVWRDPEAPVGRLLAVVASPAPELAQAPEPPLALFEAEGGAPGPQVLLEMLSLARAETEWLDD
ncbi:MAG TPA: hypothetical protein VN837_12960 [Chloroflexota bacterium]|nr:hypothetical protein [Chloroflexota bacterium]